MNIIFEKKSIIKYIIGFLLIIIPYSTVNDGLNNNDMFSEQLLSISKVFFIPVIIGFFLILPLFKYKSLKDEYNTARVILGASIFILTLFSLFELLSSVSRFISEYDISIKYLYAVNADFAARVFLLFVKTCTFSILLKPFVTYNQMKKNSDSWKKKPKDLNKTLY